MPDLTKGHTFTSGESVDHSKLNNLVGNATLNDGAVTAAKLDTGAVTSAKILDGTIADSDISSVAAVALTKLADGSDGQIIVCNSSDVPTYVAMSGDATIDNAGAVTVTAAVPTGSMVMWYTASAPTGWLLCDGEAIDSGHTALIALVGANTPNLQDRIPVGRNDTSGTFNVAVGTTGGVEDVTLTGAQSGTSAHLHGGLILGGGSGSPFGDGGSYKSTGGNTSNSTEADASSAHTNLQPYIVVNYIIKT